MSINRFGILHISDLHFGYNHTPDTVKKALVTDEFKSEMPQSDPRELFLNDSRNLFQNKPIDIIAFTGDMGIGKIHGTMELGVNFLKKLGEQLNIPPEFIVIAPGNHDVDRDAKSNREFDNFISRCNDEHFRVAKKTEPIFINMNGLPIVAINTCLGGTEKALYELPNSFWKSVKDSLDKIGEGGEDLGENILLKDMDIPAIGTTQINEIISYLSERKGNCTIILGHHNLSPTHQLVLRPYAEVIDSGQLLYSILKQDK